MAHTESRRAYDEFFVEFLRELGQRAPQLACSSERPYGDSIHFRSDKSNVHYHVGFGKREHKLRVDLSFDTCVKEANKAMFAQMYEQRDAIEAGLGFGLSWEKKEELQYSRLAVYTVGTICDPPDRLRALREWALETLPKFHQVLSRRISRL